MALKKIIPDIEIIIIKIKIKIIINIISELLIIILRIDDFVLMLPLLSFTAQYTREIL
jgi:hypothetical protein